MDLEKIGREVISPLGIKGILWGVVDGKGRSEKGRAVKAASQIKGLLLKPDATLNVVAPGLIRERAEDAASSNPVLGGALGDR